MSHTKTVSQLLTQFREAAVRAGDLRDTKAQHRAARRLQECYKKLRTTEEGRAGIIGLMADSSPHVRGPAAARCLQWVPEQARQVLEAERDEGIFPNSFEAEMTLEAFDKGHLTFDY